MDESETEIYYKRMGGSFEVKRLQSGVIQSRKWQSVADSKDAREMGHGLSSSQKGFVLLIVSFRSLALGACEY